MDKSSERHFVLVHGACHGAWCWYKVATLLRSAGHRVTALDMAASGVHPKPVNEVHSTSDYVAPLTEFMESLPAEDRVVLVGHSAGGIGISMAMERFPQKISLAVFVTAFMPGPGFNMNTVNQEFHRNGKIGWDFQFSFDKGPDQPPTAFLFGPKVLESILYNSSPREELTLATMLVRPYPMYSDEEVVLNETELTKENYGSVHRAYVVIEGDKIIRDTFQRWLIENNPTHEVKVISGSDHMVMLSNPQKLTSCLLGLIN